MRGCVIWRDRAAKPSRGRLCVYETKTTTPFRPCINSAERKLLPKTPSSAGGCDSPWVHSVAPCATTAPFSREAKLHDKRNNRMLTKNSDRQTEFRGDPPKCPSEAESRTRAQRWRWWYPCGPRCARAARPQPPLSLRCRRAAYQRGPQHNFWPRRKLLRRPTRPSRTMALMAVLTSAMVLLTRVTIADAKV